MKELDELDLKPKDLKKVKLWLGSWAAHFNSMADNAKATVERYDLEKLDFFFFTECIDILSKKPESKGVEDNEVIRKRKRAVEYSLIFRRLLGEKLNKKRPCSHCGNDDRVISSLGDGTGHYVFCEKCAMTVIVTYPTGYETCVKRVCEDLTKRGLATKKEVKESEYNHSQLGITYQNYRHMGGTLTYDKWLTVEDENKKIIEKNIAMDKEIEIELDEKKKDSKPRGKDHRGQTLAVKPLSELQHKEIDGEKKKKKNLVPLSG